MLLGTLLTDGAAVFGAFAAAITASSAVISEAKIVVSVSLRSDISATAGARGSVDTDMEMDEYFPFFDFTCFPLLLPMDMDLSTFELAAMAIGEQKSTVR